MLPAAWLALTRCKLPAEGIIAACSNSFCQHAGLTTACLQHQQHQRRLFPKLHQNAVPPTTLAQLTSLARHLTTARPHSTHPKKSQPSKPSFPRNDQITAPQVRVVLPSGETKVMDTPSAVQLARSAGLDLVQTYFDPNKPGLPPVAKVLHFGKFIAEQRERVAQQKRDQEAAAAKATRSKLVKEIKFNVQIADHDLETKLRKVTDLLEDGYKVMLVVNCKHASEKQPAQQALEYILARLQKLKDIEVGGRVAAPRAIQCLVKAK